MSDPSSQRPKPGPALVRLVIPNKGRIAQPINELIEKSGLHLVDGGERRLITRTRDPNVEILFARPIDIPEYVANGVADIGITGRDMVMERGSVVEQVLDLQTGRATLVVAVPEESRIETVADLAGAKVATEFPGITRSFFAEHGIDVTIVTVGGACEATPHLGIADAIVDLSSSGTTLRTNHLRVIEEILTSTTILIANPISLAEKREKIDEIVLALESVIRAKGQCYLMMNVHRSALADVREVLPGLSGPTVMDVASDENLVAVHAVVKEERVYQLINQLKRAGAKDILVMPIERIIR
ncbi:MULTISPECIES: ATP phosphoribosyltransferase [Methanoculleus]|jgi:ATP phosphoribosyltransferase|uniref:ATP phosphoribosyltransferase n=1 Tax=Methanoculleus thermophilus TaxID=2200 RepID=A0A1G8XZU9_9EURY|nr:MULTISPECIES: ATP phosphoribosyltransferase [Methanoculleus]NLN09279.1 ATP phosphoribosyltransferase [Methanoculleus thermophilus]SDJ96042.1 ATP phosphoribosyltransferase (homohexameric) [Methanoculleus thermophilus]HQD24982.1 ATP phosphoribosyltransferase [Methanoculleus thermophilus]